ncbi:MAG: MFS transporter [FCB group bacterium]|jgi:MFS family permease|nr:MFS transporter [FCB group bacterium]
MATAPDRDNSVATTPSLGYAWYVVGVLMVAYVFSFIDRQILSLLVGPMKADLGISDTGMSYLMGITFALLYTFLGIPMGRLADTRSRRSLIAAGMILWSVMTVGCGFARRFWELALMRVGVGVGEAALSPAAYSIITDYFPRERLGTAISVYSMGIYVGMGLAMLMGGYVVEFASHASLETWPLVADMRPWQLAFVAVGAPGVLFAFLLYTVREPLRRSHSGAAHRSAPAKAVAAYLGSNWQTLTCHHLGFALLALVGYGAAAWIPEFFMRTYGWSVSQVGLRYGLVVMTAGSLGIVAGGWLADRMSKRGYRDAKMRAGLLAAVLSIPLTVMYTLMPNGWAALAVLIPLSFVQAMPFGVAPAAIQEMMPTSMRGQASAVYLFVLNLIGLGIGPTAVALLTDYAFGDVQAVRYSLLLTGVTACVLAAGLLWMGLRHFCVSLDRLRTWETAQSTAD